MMMSYTYKGETYEIKSDALTQGEVEKFFRSLREDYGSDKVSTVEFTGNSVRADIKLGWIKPDINVDNSTPGLVAFLSGKINDCLSDALKIDPN